MSEKKENTIGKMFTMPELMKFVAAPVISKLFFSLLQTIDDSLFISRYCGKNALAAFSIALPWFMIVDAFSMVICAVSSKCSMLMGEKKGDEAKSSFTSMVIIAFFVGCFFTLILTFFKIPILRFLGATDILIPYVSEYMNVSRFYMPLLLVGNLFARFYAVSGKPKVAMLSTIVQIACNLIADYTLIAKAGIGIVGAAWGNFAGNVLICLIGVIFYSNKNNEIHFAKPLDNPLPLVKDVWKLGRSQGLTSVSISFNTYITNYILMKIGGESLIAGYTIVNNVQFMFMNAFFGFISSVSPIASYAYGERNRDKLVNIIKKATILIQCLSICVALFIFLFKDGFIFMYFGEAGDEAIKEMALYGFNVVPFCYNVFSFNVLVQELLIAVGNHKTSAFLSVLQNIVFANIVTIALPMIFGEKAIWYLFLVSESITFIFTLLVVYKNKDVYGYGKTGIATFTEN